MHQFKGGLLQVATPGGSRIVFTMSATGEHVVSPLIAARRIVVKVGSALLVDYVLTITISVASSGDAIFSRLGRSVIEVVHTT